MYSVTFSIFIAISELWTHNRREMVEAKCTQNDFSFNLNGSLYALHVYRVDFDAFSHIQLYPKNIF